MHEFLQAQSYESEVIVVNDGSHDKTSEIVKKYEKLDTRFLLIDNKQNQGKAGVTKQGMLHARGELRLFMDADNSTSIETVTGMLPFIRQGYHVVIASIGINGAHVIGHEPFYRRLLGKAGNLWIQAWAVPGIHDTQRGFKLFTKAATLDIFPRMKTFGWGFDVELLALARKFKYKIKEVPITWDNGPGSKVNIWAYPKVLLQTVVVGWNLITGAYGA